MHEYYAQENDGKFITQLRHAMQGKTTQHKQAKYSNIR